MKRDPLRILVHDLRNPLAAAQGWADLLAKDSRVPTDLAQYAEVISTRIREATLILAAVSDIFRDKTPHPVKAVRGAEVWVRWRQRSPFSKGIEWREDLDPDTLVPVSSERLQMVYTHLARNVTRFCARNPMAKVSLRTLESGAELTVSDEGPGAPEEQLKSFGTPFGTFLAPGGTNPGTGLGLAHVRRITEEAGGTFHVRAATGEGFTVTLLFQKFGENS